MKLAHRRGLGSQALDPGRHGRSQFGRCLGVLSLQGHQLLGFPLLSCHRQFNDLRSRLMKLRVEAPDLLIVGRRFVFSIEGRAVQPFAECALVVYANRIDGRIDLAGLNRLGQTGLLHAMRADRLGDFLFMNHRFLP